MKPANQELRDIAEALAIFAKYPVGQSICVEHDEILVASDLKPEQMSPEDLARVNELGWQSQKHGGFHKFV
jgi:hypothetical protein